MDSVPYSELVHLSYALEHGASRIGFCLQTALPRVAAVGWQNLPSVPPQGARFLVLHKSMPKIPSLHQLCHQHDAFVLQQGAEELEATSKTSLWLREEAMLPSVFLYHHKTMT